LFYVDQLKSGEGRADIARPILWAAETKKLVDVFIIFTDQCCSSAATDDAITPVKALHQYCDNMSRPNTRYGLCVTLKYLSLSLQLILLAFSLGYRGGSPTAVRPSNLPSVGAVP